MIATVDDAVGAGLFGVEVLKELRRRSEECCFRSTPADPRRPFDAGTGEVKDCMSFSLGLRDSSLEHGRRCSSGVVMSSLEAMRLPWWRTAWLGDWKRMLVRG